MDNKFFETIYLENKSIWSFGEILQESIIDNYDFFGIFNSNILESSKIKATFVNRDFSIVAREFRNPKYQNSIILPCFNNGTVTSNDPEKLRIQKEELSFENSHPDYKGSYEKSLDKDNLLPLSKKLLQDVNDNNITSHEAIKQRSNADPNN